jgi:hypothetical protein
MSFKNSVEIRAIEEEQTVPEIGWVSLPRSHF